MPKLLTTALLAAALAFPSAARAGPVAGVRLGWAVPVGQLRGGLDLGQYVSGVATVEVEAGWRLWRGLTLGGYASYGVARIDTFLDNLYEAQGDSTSGSVLQLGLRGEWTFRDLAAGILPWVALGAGWQRLDLSIGSDFTYFGWNLVRLEAGADWAAGRGFTVGPYASWSLGRYTKLGSGAISQQAGHAWAAFGLRGTWGP